jgi:two-component sensor histidine kinase
MEVKLDNKNNSNSDELLFSNEIEKEQKSSQNRELKPWKVLISDDDEDIHALTRIVLGDYTFEGRGLQLLNAYSGKETKELMLKNPDVALILLDVVMETEDAGFDVIRYIRENLNNVTTRIILRTGHPGSAPERDVIMEYDINDYKEKTELTSPKLFTSITTSLRSYRDLVVKETLLREVHHRVKNNLQIIVSLLRIKERLIKDEQVLRIFKESQNQIIAMSLVHEKLYQNKDLGFVEFSEYIRSLAISIFASFNVNTSIIKLNMNIKAVPMNVDLAVPCGLIINEIITNSIKHAFPNNREGEIYIEVSENSDKELLLIISDDGVGFKDGFDMFKSETMGFKMLLALIEQIDGKIELFKDKGTLFKITLNNSKKYD